MIDARGALPLLLALPALASSQEPAAPAAVPRQPRVAIIGASVSGGFSDRFITARTAEQLEHNLTLPLRAAIGSWWPADAVAPNDLSNLAFFLDPVRIGRRQVERVERMEPGLVLAIDFLFWFGYSVRGGDGEARLALQREGLALLERIRAPLVVGDYPALNDIDPRMLHPSAVPDAETLQRLNERLREWAAARRGVRIFPLSQLLEELCRRPQPVTIDGATRLLTPAALLQTDNLHATRLGMAVLAERLGEHVRALLPEDAAVRPRARSLEELIRDLDLAEAAAAATAPAPGEGAGRRQ